MRSTTLETRVRTPTTGLNRCIKLQWDLPAEHLARRRAPAPTTGPGEDVVRELFRAQAGVFDPDVGARVADVLTTGGTVVSQHVSGSMWLLQAGTLVRMSGYDPMSIDGLPVELTTVAGNSCGLLDPVVGVRSSRPVIIHELDGSDASDLLGAMESMRAAWSQHLQRLASGGDAPGAWMAAPANDHPEEACAGNHCVLRLQQPQRTSRPNPPAPRAS